MRSDFHTPYYGHRGGLGIFRMFGERPKNHYMMLLNFTSKWMAKIWKVSWCNITEPHWDVHPIVSQISWRKFQTQRVASLKYSALPIHTSKSGNMGISDFKTSRFFNNTAPPRTWHIVQNCLHCWSSGMWKSDFKTGVVVFRPTFANTWEWFSNWDKFDQFGNQVILKY